MSCVGVNVDKIRPSVVSMLRVNMGLRPGEKVLILTDYPVEEHWRSYDAEALSDMVKRSVLARIVFEVAREELSECEFSFLAYPATGRHGGEPPASAADEMKSHDVVLAITTFSLTHTRAREEACKSGSRIASMPGFTAEMLEPGGPMAVDYSEVAERAKKLAELLAGKSEVRVIDGRGTDITMRIEGREWGLDTGIYSEKGAWGNLPAGEVYIAPLEGSANGRLVVSRGWYPGLEEDMIFYVKDGSVEAVEGGGEVGERLRELLGLERAEAGPEYFARRNIAELGIGMNPNARRPDNVLEAEKIMGTVHVAIGNNVHLGGTVDADLHEDFVIPSPTVLADGMLVMDRGKFRLRSLAATRSTTERRRR